MQFKYEAFSNQFNEHITNLGLHKYSDILEWHVEMFSSLFMLSNVGVFFFMLACFLKWINLLERCKMFSIDTWVLDTLSGLKAKLLKKAFSWQLQVYNFR